MNVPFNQFPTVPEPIQLSPETANTTIRRLYAENTELRRRQQALLDILDIDRSTSISKRHVRAILKGR